MAIQTNRGDFAAAATAAFEAAGGSSGDGKFGKTLWECTTYLD